MYTIDLRRMDCRTRTLWRGTIAAISTAQLLWASSDGATLEGKHEKRSRTCFLLQKTDYTPAAQQRRKKIQILFTGEECLCRALLVVGDAVGLHFGDGLA